MPKLFRAVFIFRLLVAGLLAPALPSATLTVTSLADSGPGTLRDQVAAANPGDTIDFSVTGTIRLLAPAISIAKNLTITGPGAGSLTVAGNSPTSGNNNFAPIFQITSGVVGLSGLTLRDGTGLKALENGTFVNYGGAIHVSGAALTVSACTFTANRARFGGALYVTGDAAATVTGSAFTNNVGIEGGAIKLAGGSLSLVGSTVTAHTGGDYGGGIFVGPSSSLSISDCTIAGNSCVWLGAGIYCLSPATISNSTFSGNTATGPGGYGGGIYSAADLTLTNSTFSGNLAQGLSIGSSDPGGGGVYHAQGVARLTGCTITNNNGQNGGGLKNNGTLFMSNTIVAKNVNGSDFDSNNGYVGGYNFIGLADPMLAPLGNYGGPTQTHRPLPNSPVLDAGDPNFDATSTPYDQRGPGFPRVKNGRVCIGAYESELNQTGNTFVVNTLDDHDDGLAGMTDCTLREAINAVPIGGTIIFSVAGTIALTGGELAILQKGLNIQGPTSAPGLTISGNNASRIFLLNQSSPTPTYTVSLSNLTLTGGNGVGSLSSGTGGAINCETGMVLNVTNCTLTGNTATGTGGAIRSQMGLTVTNSTFTGNTATGTGGAIRCGGNVSFFLSTIVGNSSGSSGGGISKSTNGSQTLTLSNCIVAGNTAGTTGPDVATTATVDGDYNLIQNPAGATFTGTHNLTGLAPQLDALADNGGPTRTMQPLAGSPVLNAGSNALIPKGVTTDQRGAARIDSGTVDLGAVEVDATPPTVTLNQAAAQTDPTVSTPVHFTVVFSEPVTGFTGAKVTLGGSAGATTALVTGSGTTYDIAVSGMTQSGTVQATLAPGAALDAAGNGSSASSSTDNSVFYYSAEQVQRSGTIQAAPGGGFAVGFLGNPGTQYTIQSTSALTLPWTTLQTQTADANGAISIVDQPPPGTGERFYRLYVP